MNTHHLQKPINPMKGLFKGKPHKDRENRKRDPINKISER